MLVPSVLDIQRLISDCSSCHCKAFPPKIKGLQPFMDETIQYSSGRRNEAQVKCRRGSEKDHSELLLALKIVVEPCAICGFSQRPFIIRKQNTMAAREGAVPWSFFTIQTLLLLKSHSWPWAIQRARSISVLRSTGQCWTPWVPEHTSSAWHNEHSLSRKAILYIS